MRDIRPQTPKSQPKHFPLPEMGDRDIAYNPAPSRPRFTGAKVPVTSITVPAQPPARALAPKTTSARHPRLGQRERIIVLSLFSLAGLVAILGAIIFLPSANIKLLLQTAPLLVEEKLTLKADKTGDSSVVPGTAFFREVQVEGTSPVMSTEVVGEKAKSTVFIVNRTLDEQKIKERSRLVTKDGTLFYMTKSVTVPAATTGAPARAEVTVEAANAGKEGNIEPQRLDFAALDISAQSMVYAEATKAISGGTGDTVAVIKDEDIAAAKTAAGKLARDKVEQDIRSELPSKGWAILEESWTGEIGSFETTAKAGNRQAEIPFTARVTVRVMGYEQTVLEEKLKNALSQHLDDQYMLFPGPISYTKSVDKTNWESAESTITARVTHTTIPKFSLDTLKNKLAGRSQTEAKQYLEGLPGVKSVDIKLWPFWVNSIPRIENKIQLDLQPEKQP